MNLSERTLNVLYAGAALSGIPGVVAYLQVATAMGPLLLAASLFCYVVATLGFLNRNRRFDTVASGLLALYATMLGALGIIGVALTWIVFE